MGGQWGKEGGKLRHRWGSMGKAKHGGVGGVVGFFGGGLWPCPPPPPPRPPPSVPPPPPPIGVCAFLSSPAAMAAGFGGFLGLFWGLGFWFFSWPFFGGGVSRFPPPPPRILCVRAWKSIYIKVIGGGAVLVLPGGGRVGQPISVPPRIPASCGPNVGRWGGGAGTTPTLSALSQPRVPPSPVPLPPKLWGSQTAPPPPIPWTKRGSVRRGGWGGAVGSPRSLNPSPPHP